MKINTEHTCCQRPATLAETRSPADMKPEAVASKEKDLQTTQQPRHGRRHVMRDMKQMERVIRHAIRNEFAEMKEAGVFDDELAEAVKDLADTFHQDLKSIFHDAGRGHDFDPLGIPDSIDQALMAFRSALHILLGGDAEPPVEVAAGSDLMVDPPEMTESPNPGGLLLNATA